MPLVHACSWEGCNILTMGEYCLEHEQLEGKDDSLEDVVAAAAVVYESKDATEPRSTTPAV